MRRAFSDLGSTRDPGAIREPAFEEIS